MWFDREIIIFSGFLMKKIFFHCWLQDVLLQNWCEDREYINKICYGSFYLWQFSLNLKRPKNTLILAVMSVLCENNEHSNNHLISIVPYFIKFSPKSQYFCIYRPFLHRKSGEISGKFQNLFGDNLDISGLLWGFLVKQGWQPCFSVRKESAVERRC